MDSARETALDLIRFIDASPSRTTPPPRPCAGYRGRIHRLAPADAWPSGPGRYVVVDGGSLFAWIVPPGAAPGSRFRLLGAHTDSPTLRVKPRPDTGRAASGSSASRSTAARCSTPGSIATWAWPAGGGPHAGGPQVRLVRVHRPLLRSRSSRSTWTPACARA